MTFPRRRSIEIKGVGHGSAPIPMGARVGAVVHSSGIPGTDASTGEIPTDPRAQVRHVFRNLDSFLAEADVTHDDVVRLTVLLVTEELRDAVNEEWLVRFPEPSSRPARHTTIGPLRAGMLVQLEVIAVAAE
ncbi:MULTISPECIES: RidA family protein [unclassified Streptomyces]|uniref:RidA family protein n=1 Tax=unclassified Streptomyces TaxID=2593676 RepID=UPI00381E1A68